MVSFVKIGVAARGWADDVITNDDGGGDVGAFSHRNDPKTDTQQRPTAVHPGVHLGHSGGGDENREY